MLHTGDWKLDPTPVIGPPTDEAKLRALGDEGCLALVGDSTNAVRDGRSPSETDVAKTLRRADRATRRRASRSRPSPPTSRACAPSPMPPRACGREVVVVGRAMERIVQVARETGYLDGVQEFRGTDAYGYLPPDKVVALCTGSQGEPRAALARIAEDEHPDVTLARGRPGDLLLAHHSRQREGGRRASSTAWSRQGIEVITDRTHLVHVSGHPRRAEMEELYSLGAAAHRRCRCTARRCILPSMPRSRARPACREVVICRNGDLVRLAPGRPASIDEVPQRPALQGRRAAGRRRRRAPSPTAGGSSFAGIVSVALALDDRASSSADPEVELIGIPEADADGAVDARHRLRRRARHRRAVAASRAGAIPRRSRRRSSAAVRAAIAAQLGQEADLPRAGADGIDASDVELEARR